MPNRSPIERLTTGSLSTLWAEGRTTPMQMALVAEFAKGSFGHWDGRLDLDLARNVIQSRLPRAPMLLKQIHRPFPGGGRPAWIDAHGFDIARHVDAVQLSTHWSEADFLNYAANEAVRPVDRSVPPWRMRFVTGWDGGRIGLVIVVHHVLADGTKGIALLGSLLDPQPSDLETHLPLNLRPPPTWTDFVTDRLRTDARAALGFFRSFPKLIASLRTNFRAIRHGIPYLKGEVTRTSMSRPVGAGRRVVLLTRPLDRVKATAHRDGATVNDVILEALRSAVRALLFQQGALDGSVDFRVSCPMELQGDDPNGLGFMIIRLPVSELDAAAAYADIRQQTRERKRERQSGEAPTFTAPLPRPLMMVSVRVLKKIGARKVSSFVTDITGPPRNLWLGPAEVIRAVPLAPLAGEVPLSIAVLSWGNELNILLHADDQFEELSRIARGMNRRMDELMQGAESAHLPTAPGVLDPTHARMRPQSG